MIQSSSNPIAHHTKYVAFLACLGACLGVCAMTGCRGDRSEKPPRQFFPDLDDQPKWSPQSETEFFADGRAMRKPVSGTVPFGRVSYVSNAEWSVYQAKERADFLKADDRSYLGKNPDGTYVEKIPVEVTQSMIEHGRNRYNIYCVACHGYSGDGKGMVGEQWSAPLPSYHDEKYKKPDAKDPKIELWKDGYLFHTARWGVPGATPEADLKMPGYAHALDERDAWAIVAFIRALQESRSATIQDVPEQERQVLERQRAALPASEPDKPKAAGGNP